MGVEKPTRRELRSCVGLGKGKEAVAVAGAATAVVAAAEHAERQADEPLLLGVKRNLQRGIGSCVGLGKGKEVVAGEARAVVAAAAGEAGTARSSIGGASAVRVGAVKWVKSRGYGERPRAAFLQRMLSAAVQDECAKSTRYSLRSAAKG
jgi:hypothetical protein